MLPVGVATSTHVEGVQVQRACVYVCACVCGVPCCVYFTLFFSNFLLAHASLHTHTPTHCTHAQPRAAAYIRSIYIYTHIYMPAERLCQRDEQTDRQPHKTDRNSHELCIMQRAKKKLFQFLQLHLMAARRGGRGRARGKRGSCLCLPPNACSMQCLYLPLLLQVNLPHRLCLITVSRRDGERGEREGEAKRRRKSGRQTDDGCSLRWQFISLQASAIFHTSFSVSAHRQEKF